MKAYILSIAGMILLSAVVAIVCPSGKMGKFVKGTVRLFILVVMLAPLIGWVQSGKLELNAASAIGTDTRYLEHCAELLEERDEEEISAYLLAEFNVIGRADVTRSAEAGFPRERIRIFLAEDGIIGEDERIHKLTCIRESVETRYGCRAEVAYDGQS